MKFSWQLINSFIRVEEKKFKEIEDRLILSGIEIENIEKSNNDKILDLSITTNRKEINSVFSLAREISIITNTEMTTVPTKLKFTKNNHKEINSNSTHLNYIRIHVIDNRTDIQTPQWILNQLKINKIRPKNILENVQQYIKIKWGQTFSIIDKTNSMTFILENQLQDNENFITSLINKKKIYENKLALIIFKTKKTKLNNNLKNYDDNEFYENYYIESLKIITTLYKNTIGKYEENYKLLKLTTTKVNLKHSTINKCLGSIHNKQVKFLEITNTIKILKRLYLSPQYVRNKRLFTLQIPEYRSHDLKRDIDIIEEIGKIHEFRNFYSINKKNKKRGHKSTNLININNIKIALRNLGLNEVINCSLTTNNLYTLDTLKIYNPISTEQQELRKNIVEGLIKNYEHHVKYSNKNLLIFEIGKVFNKDKNTNFSIENKSLGGLIHATEYNRKDWLERPQGIHLLQIKGLIELFLEKINAEIELIYISNKTEKHSINNLIIQSSQIGIYNKKNNKIIGAIGELSKKNLSKTQKKLGKVYIFEIDLKSLISCIKLKKHLSYRKNAYSGYPSIVRDISIKIKKHRNIQEIEEKINDISHKLIESIKIFNEYTNNNINQDRSIGIRITYRSFEKTLKIADIEEINHKVNKIINNIK
uniref:phenylalanine--tRNA ligase n=1 Tax=Vertebrata isogona TaxID=2006944 RepID=A0A1Z1MEH7_9FLOR|nr:Phenylalanine-tRNA ligase beta subunit [Vertebrata isogona]ARW64477.1 Phenylalanine-tRNA ligase beta subunit [Vertebrata isogona]